MSGRGSRTETDRVIQPLPELFPTLRVLYSADTGSCDAPARTLLLGITPIGRDVSAADGIDLPNDRRASRLHATLHVDPAAGEVRLVDADSKNGVFVNGQRTRELPLRDGDVIRVGNSLLLLRYERANPVDFPIDGMLGVSPAIRQARSRIAQIARSESIVLILGESGTGKEVTARAVHAESGRRGPLLAVNCAAIPESLAESHLFGHVAGSFTGARAQHPGFFRSAHGGTLFLDEVGELPLGLQPKLLRVLEERAVVPVGATQPVPCDVRLVAATNRDLSEAARSGRFRGDLYARLAAHLLLLPPLRARREDILPILLNALTEPGASPPRLTLALAEALLLHPFPYNVRELLALSAELKLSARKVEVMDLPLIAERLTLNLAAAAAAAAPSPSRFPPPRIEDEEPEGLATDSSLKRPLPKDELIQLLRDHHGLIAKVAVAAGRSRRQIARWLELYGLNREDFIG